MFRTKTKNGFDVHLTEDADEMVVMCQACQRVVDREAIDPVGVKTATKALTPVARRHANTCSKG